MYSAFIYTARLWSLGYDAV